MVCCEFWHRDPGTKDGGEEFGAFRPLEVGSGRFQHDILTGDVRQCEQGKPDSFVIRIAPSIAAYLFINVVPFD